MGTGGVDDCICHIIHAGRKRFGSRRPGACRNGGCEGGRHPRGAAHRREPRRESGAHAPRAEVRHGGGRDDRHGDAHRLAVDQRGPPPGEQEAGGSSPLAPTIRKSRVGAEVRRPARLAGAALGRPDSGHRCTCAALRRVRWRQARDRAAAFGAPRFPAGGPVGARVAASAAGVAVPPCPVSPGATARNRAPEARASTWSAGPRTPLRSTRAARGLSLDALRQPWSLPQSRPHEGSVREQVLHSVGCGGPGLRWPTLMCPLTRSAVGRLARALLARPRCDTLVP